MIVIHRRRGVTRPSAPLQQDVAPGSLLFPGGASGANSGAVRIPRASGSAINVGGGEFTLEMWIRPSETAGDNAQTAPTEGANYSGTDGNIIWDADGNSTGLGFIVGLDAGVLYLSVTAVGGAGGTRTEIGTTDLRDGNWHHVAVYRAATGGLMELFVDGNREGTVTGPTGSIAHPNPVENTDGYHVIAKEKLNIGFGFDGDVSEIRVSTNRRYNGATYTVPTAPFSADGSTVGLYHFDEGTGNDLGDSSGNDQTGELIGTPDPVWSTQDPF